MKPFFLFIAMATVALPLQAAETGYTSSTTLPVQQHSRQVKIELEVDENEIKEYGLKISDILSEINTRLTLGQIQIKNDIEAPILVLRIKSIEQDKLVAAFVQLSFFEKASLLRNHSLILAQTWSKAAMVGGPKEMFTKEVTDAITSMVNTFVLDYQKALS